MENLKAKLDNIEKLQKQWTDDSESQGEAWVDVEKKLALTPHNTDEINEAFEKYMECCEKTRKSRDELQKACSKYIEEDLSESCELYKEILARLLERKEMTPANINDGKEVIDYLRELGLLVDGSDNNQQH